VRTFAERDPAHSFTFLNDDASDSHLTSSIVSDLALDVDAGNVSASDCTRETFCVFALHRICALSSLQSYRKIK